MSELPSELLNSIFTSLAAVGILLVAWLVGLAARFLALRLFRAIKLNTRLVSLTAEVSGAEHEDKRDYERLLSSVVFWVVMFLGVIGLFNVLKLDALAAPFSAMVSSVTQYLPRLAAGVILLAAAWVLATVVRKIANTLLEKTRLDDKLSKAAEVEPISNTLANVLYWFVLLLFVPAIVGAFQIEGLMRPLDEMMIQLLAALPNVIAALFIGSIGWLIARVLRGLTTNLLASTGIDKFSATAGLSDKVKISLLSGTIVFIVVFVPALIAALEALNIAAISQPASEMLAMFFNAVPNILAAALILAISWFVGRFVTGLLATLLHSVGADALPEKIGASEMFKQTKLSAAAGGIALFFIMLFATVEAANRLEFSGVSELIGSLIAFGGKVLLGALIITLGYWISRLVSGAIRKAGGASSELIASAVQFAIVSLIFAMGLTAMGVADDIVQLAFGLLFGAFAVAFAIAFGIGGRDSAARIAAHWTDKFLGK